MQETGVRYITTKAAIYAQGSEVVECGRDSEVVRLRI
jgi:hypothetical protein